MISISPLVATNLESSSQPDSLLSLEVSKVSSRDSSGDAALGEEDGILSSGVGTEARPVGLLDSSLSSSVGLDTGEGGEGGAVANNDVLLGTDHGLCTRDSGHLEEAIGLVTEGVVDALGKGEASRQGGGLGAGNTGRHGEGEDKEGWSWSETWD